MAFTKDTTFGALKALAPHLRMYEMGRARTACLNGPRADEAVRASTAFTGLDDALDTQLHYAPKFALSRCVSSAEREVMLTAGFAFNLAAERAGQARRCLFF